MTESRSTAKGLPHLWPGSLAFAWLVLISGMARPVAAQTDFYNTDKGRPMMEHIPAEHRDSVERMRGEPPADREHHDSSSDVGTPAHKSPAAKSPGRTPPVQEQPMDSMPGMDHGRMFPTGKP